MFGYGSQKRCGADIMDFEDGMVPVSLDTRDAAPLSFAWVSSFRHFSGSGCGAESLENGLGP
jgi:hypothetical protein